MTYPINVIGTGAANNRFAVTVFADWDQDGDFNDAGEQYFTTSPFLGANLAVNNLTGNITVPADALIGTTRMRVKYNFNSSATSISSALSDPCGNMSNGQVEDYTLNVTGGTAGTSNVDKNKVKVYPNPFKDVLKISDVSYVESISISDVTGRVVRTVKASAEINLSDLKTGMYLIILNKNDGSTQTVKAIKK